MLVDVGRGALVESRDVVYIAPGFYPKHNDQIWPIWTNKEEKAGRCQILLKNGCVVAGFITIETLRKRLWQAERDEANQAHFQQVTIRHQ